MAASQARPWTARQIGFFKPLLFIVCLYPVMRWLWLGFQGALTANPPEFLIRSSGIWALVALCLTLAVTPLRRCLGQPALLRCRRMLGLFTFFYSALHVLGWAYWERGLSLSAMWDDIVQRPFIAIGVLAMVPMLAQAVTSTRGWMSRLGARWHTLHRAIYPVAILSVWHFWLIRAGKNDFAEVYAYGAVLGLLLLARLVPLEGRRGNRP
ncbi:sulfite oxidase heme-binding subunit YedZ [Pusillimonas noertemannii]|uniref:Protein-methionine-sulfoxide reductase heme-binding subunit MsrQ n=1 Tax=Pusillimonas noertemannii TaxID=305977 RepID=A0A2U1CS64_9BURK|nr:protein-methionine-sulfoxide reductase heme-binding subunit MsrQ [Pusillimonas noertemannii]NYT68060.1 sulfoxide reductase heme-binding subunit YedZ [Pusillimonas noertemannii]PVY68738.1 sulfoxide reductase heme-binding subunit YedZ [Pusillimonas noertemannii]TFL11805.1 sulfoxide reductase heme-binding subunit YedZ [Pusillimonas noertemannii]